MTETLRLDEPSDPSYSFQSLQDYDQAAFRELVVDPGGLAADVSLVQHETLSDIRPDDTYEHLSGRQREMLEVVLADKRREEAEKHWWLDPHWNQMLAEGRLREQYRIDVVASTEGADGGSASIDIYNFGADLSPMQVDTMNSVVRAFVQNRQLTTLKKTSAVLVHPNEYIPEELHGIKDVNNATGLFVPEPAIIGLSQIGSRNRLIPWPDDEEDKNGSITTQLHATFAHELGHAQDMLGVGDSITYEQLGWRGSSNGEFELTDTTHTFRDHARSNPLETAADIFALLSLRPQLIPHDTLEDFRLTMAANRLEDPGRFRLKLPGSAVASIPRRLLGEQMTLPSVSMSRYRVLGAIATS